MNPFLSLIRLLSDPTIAFLLFSTRLDGPARGALQPELRDRHPRRR